MMRNALAKLICALIMASAAGWLVTILHWPMHATPSQETVHFTLLASGHHSPYRPSQSASLYPYVLVVSTAAEYLAYWPDSSHVAGQSIIDFNDTMLILIGLHRSPFYGDLKVNEVTTDGQAIYLHVTLSALDGSSITTDLIPSPYQLISVPKREMPIKLNIITR